MVHQSSKKEFLVAMQVLVETMNPDKVFFATGRTKNRGVGIELGKIIERYN